MATLTVRNLPDEVHRALRIRAATHGRSTEAEVRDILEMVARPPERIKLGSLLASIAREAGSRTKMAVWSNDENVDPIGACVGPKGGRVASIVNELNGEKIDIIKYSDDPEEYIAAALSPSEVVSVTMLEDGKSCRVIVPDSQLSLAIGKEGQNARLAAKRHDPQQIAELEALLAEGVNNANSGDADVLGDLNQKFHSALGKVAANSVLQEVMLSLRDRTAVLFAPRSRERAPQNWEEHAAILRAVIKGDPELAGLLAARHIYNAAGIEP